MYPCLDWQYVNVIFRLLMISPLMSIHVHTHQNEERKYKVIDTEYEVKVMKGQKKKKKKIQKCHPQSANALRTSNGHGVKVEEKGKIMRPFKSCTVSPAFSPIRVHSVRIGWWCLDLSSFPHRRLLSLADGRLLRARGQRTHLCISIAPVVFLLGPVSGMVYGRLVQLVRVRRLHPQPLHPGP